MKNVTAAFWLGVMIAAAPAVAFADDSQPQPQILNSSAGAVSGANRMGGPTMTSPPHAWTATGQSPEALSTDDTRRESPRNPSVVGPPVPRHVTLPLPQVKPQDDKSPSDQPAQDRPAQDHPTTDQPTTDQPAPTDQ
jgi:hypothetical protein